MFEPGRGAWRIVRGAALAVACTVIAAAGHTAGGGSVGARHLPVAPLLVCGVLLGAAFAIAADRQRGAGAIAAVAVGSQFLFHGTFALVGHDALIPDARMTGSHIAAALIMGGLVARADALLWAIAELFGMLRVPDPTPVPILLVRPTRPEALILARDPADRFGRANPRRGPPALA